MAGALSTVEPSWGMVYSGVEMVYSGVEMVYSGVGWCTVEWDGVQWSGMVYSGVGWCTVEWMVYSGVETKKIGVPCTLRRLVSPVH